MEAPKALGLKIAPGKCQSIIFSRKKIHQLIPGVSVGDLVIRESQTLVYLGVKLVSRLSRLPHIMMLESRSNQAIGAMTALARENFGVNPQPMHIVLRGLIRAIVFS